MIPTAGCRLLRTPVALVLGASIMVNPGQTLAFAKLGVLSPTGCQGRRGDHQSEVRDDTWTMRVGEVSTDQHNTTLGNWRRNLTEGQSFVTCSDLRYPTADMRGGGSTGGQEEFWSQRSSLVVTSENPVISNLGRYNVFLPGIYTKGYRAGSCAQTRSGIRMYRSVRT